MKIKKECSKCKIAKFRRNRVIGRGSIPADILFIGEAPGKSEDLLGYSFVGPAGVLLDKMLYDVSSKISLDNMPSFYITNVIQCRPCEEKFGDNRQPEPLEILNCMENFMNVYHKVNPKLIIFIGRIAEKYYKKEFPNSCHIIHPASLLREGGTASPNYLSSINILTEAFKFL